MEKIKTQFILIDGSFYIYRAYHAFPKLTNTTGEDTGAIYGFITMLKNLLISLNPNHIAIVFDSKKKTFRHKLFEKYKSNRPSMPFNLQTQIKPLYEILKAMGFPLIEIDGMESDDIIGTLALEASKHESEVLIATNDKDMAQLVTKNISLINSETNSILGPEEIKKKYGVPPSLIIDLLAIIGDSADNIPGIKGIGKKTAKILLENIGNMKSIYKNLDNIANISFRGSKTTAEKFKKNREIAFLSYELATIKTNLKLNISYQNLIIKKQNFTKLKTLFTHYEFKKWLTEIQKQKNKTIFPTNTSKIQISKKNLTEKYSLILDLYTLENWLNKLKNHKMFAFDLKTDSKNILNANITGIAFAISENEISYLPLNNTYENTHSKLNENQIITHIKPIFEDPNLTKIGENLKFFHNILKKYNIKINGTTFDVTLESYVLDNLANKQKITDFSKKILNYKKFNSENFTEKNNKQYKKQIETKETEFNIAKHTCAILKLHLQIWSKLKNETKLKKILEEIDIPLLKVLSRMESNGVLIDQTLLKQYSKQLEKNLKKEKEKAYKLIGYEFNLLSTKQISNILFKKEGITSLKTTLNKNQSANKQVLKKIIKEHSLPKILLKYRTNFKLKSTYTDKLFKKINNIDGRIHSSYHQTNTLTGRLTSTNPNLQNLPIRKKNNPCIRKLFIAKKENKILTADYSQIELRILAHLSQDEKLLYAFSNNQDIHCITASEIFKTSLNKITTQQRNEAKSINFSLIYGITSYGLSNLLKIRTSEAKQYIDTYFKQHPNILKYIQETREKALETGYVETLEGRRLWIPNIKSLNNSKRKIAERTAINAPIQGTAADIIKLAMISIDKWLIEQKKAKMIIQIHDELVFEIDNKIIDMASKKIRTKMENITPLDIPLLVKIGIGNNLDEAHS